MSKEQEKNACDWLENLEGDAWADACEEIAGAVKRQAEGAPGEQISLRRALEQAYMALIGYLPAHRNAVTDAAIEAARAALAQPSPAPDLDDQSFDDNAERLTRDALGPGAGINPNATSIDDLFLDETPAPELERPEVVAVLVLGGVFDGGELGDNDIVTVNPAIERLQAALVTDGEVLVELMTVAQHERIVGALRAELETERQRLTACGVAVLGYFDGCADAYRSASLEDVLKLRAECDAALARIAELEKQEPVGVMRASGELGVAPYADIWPWLEPGTQLYAAPVAQAGQVPAGYALIPTRLLLDKELIESIAFHCGDGGGSYGDYQDGILFIGEITDDDGRQVHGLHLACAECEEEGYTTLIEFAAAPAQGGE